jgi:hypothetical protein
MKQMQEHLARSLEEQAKLQPQINGRSRRHARLQKDHQERIPRENRRQGGDEFLVFRWNSSNGAQ